MIKLNKQYVFGNVYTIKCQLGMRSPLNTSADIHIYAPWILKGYLLFPGISGHSSTAAASTISGCRVVSKCNELRIEHEV